MAKRRANGEGNIRKRKDGRWEGRYTVGTDANGKTVTRNVLGKTQAEVKDKLKKAIAENRGVSTTHTGDYTVAEWCRIWFETYSKPHLRPTTVNYYNNFLEHHIIPAIGDIKLRKLTTTQVQKLYNDTGTSGRVKRNDKITELSLSVRSVRGTHLVLNSALKQAVKERLINENPCDNCRIPKIEKKEMKIIPPEKIGAYLKAAEEYGMLPVFYLELTSGLRRGELLALLWTDINTEKKTVSVTKQVGRVNGELLVSTPKTPNAIRTVSIPQQAVDLLIAEHDRHPDSPYMFPSPVTDTMFSPDALGRVHKKLLKKAGIDESVRFHDLRHTFSTVALQNGVDVKTLSSILGHYSAAFTLDTYTHVTTKMQQEAAEKMGSFMESAV